MLADSQAEDLTFGYRLQVVPVCPDNRVPGIDGGS
jgi:hypothetical protein